MKDLDGRVVNRTNDHEHTEARSEIKRHHDDFASIQGIVDSALDGDTEYELALLRIRRIVG